MDAAIKQRVLAAVTAIGSGDLARIGAAVVEVLLAAGIDLKQECSCEEMKRLLVAAVRAANSASPPKAPLGHGIADNEGCSGNAQRAHVPQPPAAPQQQPGDGT